MDQLWRTNCVFQLDTFLIVVRFALAYSKANCDKYITGILVITFQNC